MNTLDAPGPGPGEREPGRADAARWLLRALRNEVLGFSFDYPIDASEAAGPRGSLHYYVYSDRLFFDAMRLDERGVPFQRSRALGDFYNPAYVAWYGLMAAEQSLRRGLHADERFDRQAAWLRANYVRQANGEIVWTFPVDVVEGRAFLRAPWVSAMIQGLAISLLIRVHRRGRSQGDELDLCRGALGVFRRLVTEGGVKTIQDGAALYEEYPAFPLPRVLDGFLFSLLGLYDLWGETADADARALFDEGVEGLVRNIERWNYRDRWSWYGSHGYLCPPHYHALNRALVASLGRLTGESTLLRFADRWNAARLSPVERANVYARFVVLKQRARVRARMYSHGD